MKKYKVFAFLLALLFVFYAIPVNIYAEFGKNEESEPDEEEQKSGYSYEYDSSTRELVELRDAHTKHFRTAEGNYVAYGFDRAVHVLNDDGEWEDINNTLSATLFGAYKNEGARIRFAKKVGSSSGLFVLKENGNKLSWSLLNGKGAEGVVDNSLTYADYSLQKNFALENFSSKVTYKNALENVDLIFSAIGLDVAQSIIIHKNTGKDFSASFELKLNGLVPQIAKDGSIEICTDKGEVVYIIPLPVAYDASGTASAGADTTLLLEKQSGKKYVVTLCVKESFLCASDRCFPVTLATGITKAQPEAVISTAYQWDNSNELTAKSALIAENTVISRQDVSLPTLPDNASITRVILNISENDVSDGIDGVALYQTNCAKAAMPREEDLLGVSYREDGYSWDITAWVSKNPEEEFGVALTSFSEDEGAVNDSQGEVLSNMSVTYVMDVGLESYYSTSTYGAGVAGVVTVNHASGNLTLSIPTISTSNHILSYTPTLFYHGYMKDSFFTATLHSTPISPSPLAKGYKLSAHESIMLSDEDYVYMDADGTTHHFLSSSADENNILYDEDGLRLSMAVSSNEITITDASNTIKIFRKLSAMTGWLLVEIKDAEGNALEFSYNASNRLSEILFCPYGSTTKITEIQFLYNTNGMLIAVYSMRTGDATLFRYSDAPEGLVSSTAREYLCEVEYIVGGVSASALTSYYNNRSQNTGIVVKSNALYTYNSDSSLYSLKDAASGNYLFLLYTNDDKIFCIGESTVAEDGAAVFFEYGYGYTDVRTSGSDDIIETDDDTITRYIFDENNRAISVYSFHASTYEIYGAMMGKYETQANVKNNLKEQTVTGGSSVNYLLNSGFDIAGENSVFAHWYNSSTGIYSAAADNGSPACACLFPKNNQIASLSQEVYLESGTYTFSMQLDSREAELYSLIVYIFPSDQSEYPYVDETVPTKTTFSYGSNSFYSKEFTVTEAKTVMVEIKAIPNGTSISGVCIDNVMLEKSIGASEYSYVQVGSFEDTVGDQANISSSAVQSFWRNQSNTNVSLAEDYYFGKALQIQGTYATAYATTRVYQASATTLNSYDNDPYYFISNSDINFILSGYSKSTYSSSSSSAKFRMYAILTYYTGYGNQEITRTVDVSFLRDCESWQYASVYISGKPQKEEIPEGNTEGDYICLKSIDIYCDFSNQPTSTVAYFDNISFIQADNATHESYEYSAGGLLTQKKNKWYIDSYTYDSDDRLFLHQCSDGSAEMYLYDSTKIYRISKVIQYQRQKNFPDRYYPEILAEYTYLNTGLLTSEVYKAVNPALSASPLHTISNSYMDAYGNAVVEQIKFYNYTIPTNSLTVASEYTYYTNTSYYGAIQKETNGTDRSIYYHYTSDGKIVATINQYAGDGIAYSYDEKENLVGVFPAKLYSSNGYTTVTDAEAVQYTYDNANRLSAISTESTTYSFSYDIFGNNTEIKVGEDTLVSYEYGVCNGKLTKVNYGNGISVEYGYDGVENLTEVWYNENGTRTLAYEYEYTAKGQLVQIYDYLNDEGTNYRYNEAGLLIGEHTYALDEDDFRFSNDYTYNELGNLSYAQSALAYTYNNTATLALLNTSYSYDAKQRPFRTTNQSGSFSLVSQNAYDTLGRISSRTLTAAEGSNAMLLGTEITYRTFGNGQTDALVSAYSSEVTNTDGSTSTTTYTYTYDSKDNITKIVYSTGKEIRYYYDDLSQLIREDNGFANRTYVYTYDNAGNITVKQEYSLAAENVKPTNLVKSSYYTYGNTEWGDQLTKYRGQEITYDAVGNPLSYYNNSRYTFTWTQGRRLASATLGSKAMTFTYNDAGLRTSKTVNGVTTEYFYSGSLLMAQQTGDEILMFFYDESGSPLGFQYRNGTYASGVYDEYIYEKNLQGDIVAIYNNVGTKLVAYRYDAWGVTTTNYYNSGSSTGASKNPFTYRGYYYDSDLKFYYLQSRYYDAAIGRFINADASLYHTMLGYNMYVYCYNNPVNCVDYTGESAEGILQGVLAFGSVFSFVDGPLPIGEALVIIAIIVNGAFYISKAINADETTEPEASVDKPKSDTPETDVPDVKYPGDDPTKAPEGYEWKGKPPQGGKKGGYKTKTPGERDSWHPDLDHGGEIDPHWDYNDKFGNSWRVFPDGRIELKK